MTRLAKDFDRLGITPTSAAKETGLPQPVIQRWYRGTRPITKAGAIKLAALLGRTPQALLFLERSVHIVGKVGAASEAHYHADAAGYYGLARLPENGSEHTVAVEVEGDSLGAAYNGWILYYDDRRDPPTSDLLNKLCVVGLDTGQVLVKRLMRGRAPGRFDLWAAVGGDPIADQVVQWAAKVIGQFPPEEAKIEESQEQEATAPPERKRPSPKKRQAAPKRARR